MIEDIEVTGDQLQSAASRMAEWILEHYREAPYEVHMAALEARCAVDDWTRIRISEKVD